MAERYDDRYRSEPFRGERGDAGQERGFVDRARHETRSWLRDDTGRSATLDRRARTATRARSRPASS